MRHGLKINYFLCYNIDHNSIMAFFQSLVQHSSDSSWPGLTQLGSFFLFLFFFPLFCRFRLGQNPCFGRAQDMKVHSTRIKINIGFRPQETQPDLNRTLIYCMYVYTNPMDYDCLFLFHIWHSSFSASLQNGKTHKLIYSELGNCNS